MEVLRLAPLNQLGVYTVVNASSDFCIVNTVEQTSAGGALVGIVKDKFVMCRELALSRRTDLPADETLVHLLAGTSLEVEESPFFFVAYDLNTFRYVEEHAQPYQEFPKGKLMCTKKGVAFYLTNEREVNSIFPSRMRLGDISILVKKRKK